MESTNCRKAIAPAVIVTGRCAGLSLALLPAVAPAQFISTTSVSAVPVDNPVALTLLLLGLLMSAAFALRRGRGARRVLSLLLVACAAAWLGHGSGLVAQVVTAFTNPNGETLPIPVSPVMAGGFSGFQPADFANSSGRPLKIAGIVLPDSTQCFAAHPANTLLPAGVAAPSPHPACGSSTILVNGASCRVDVEAVCRSLVPAPPSVTLAAVSPAAGSASGGVGVTLTGTNLAGTTGITFGGIAATSINVVNATTVTAVAPAHAVGAVDVVATTPQGSATLASGYTLVATAVGQHAYGGTIATLNGGLQDMIASTADNSTSAEWGGMGTDVGAHSNTDGASNTATIVAALGAGSYAAAVCTAYQVDSQGNTPCQAGNTCYSDWFLPAVNQIVAIYPNRAAIGGFNVNGYWSSTEATAVNPANGAWRRLFSANNTAYVGKNNLYGVRCVRAFTP